jgi:hypothetical protein
VNISQRWEYERGRSRRSRENQAGRSINIAMAIVAGATSEDDKRDRNPRQIVMKSRIFIFP